LNFVQVAVGEIVSIVGFTLFLFCALKVFQIKAELTEIKELLSDIKRITGDYSVPQPAAVSPLQAAYQSPDAVLRAIDDKSYAE
jgi:hypothetical protein